MKNLALALLLASSSLPLRAQVTAAPDGAAVPKKEQPSCPCDQPGFKPLTEKARAAQEYWHARRKTKIASVVGGTGVLFSLLFGDAGGVNNSAEVYNRARAEMMTAKVKAEALKAVTVVGDAIDGKITFHLEKGVDY